MVVDCGGGTIDITVHELVSVNRPVAELHKVCGAPFGSTGQSDTDTALITNILQKKQFSACLKFTKYKIR